MPYNPFGDVDDATISQAFQDLWGASPGSTADPDAWLDISGDTPSFARNLGRKLLNRLGKSGYATDTYAENIGRDLLSARGLRQLGNIQSGQGETGGYKSTSDFLKAKGADYLKGRTTLNKAAGVEDIKKTIADQVESYKKAREYANTQTGGSTTNAGSSFIEALNRGALSGVGDLARREYSGSGLDTIMSLLNAVSSSTDEAGGGYGTLAGNDLVNTFGPGTSRFNLPAPPPPVVQQNPPPTAQNPPPTTATDTFTEADYGDTADGLQGYAEWKGSNPTGDRDGYLGYINGERAKLKGNTGGNITQPPAGGSNPLGYDPDNIVETQFLQHFGRPPVLWERAYWKTRLEEMGVDPNKLHQVFYNSPAAIYKRTTGQQVPAITDWASASQYFDKVMGQVPEGKEQWLNNFMARFLPGVPKPDNYNILPIGGSVSLPGAH